MRGEEVRGLKILNSMSAIPLVKIKCDGCNLFIRLASFLS